MDGLADALCHVVTGTPAPEIRAEVSLRWLLANLSTAFTSKVASGLDS